MVTSRSICHYGPLLALFIIITLFLCGLYCTFLWFPPWTSIAGAIHVTVFVSWVTLIIKYFLKSIWLGPGYLPLRWRLVSILILRTTEDENVCRQMEIATIVFWLCKNIYRWFSRYVIAAMLVDENKRFLISSFCSSTSNCTLQHCYLCPWRLVATHL